MLFVVGLPNQRTTSWDNSSCVFISLVLSQKKILIKLEKACRIWTSSSSSPSLLFLDGCCYRFIFHLLLVRIMRWKNNSSICLLIVAIWWQRWRGRRRCGERDDGVTAAADAQKSRGRRGGRRMHVRCVVCPTVDRRRGVGGIVFAEMFTWSGWQRWWWQRRRRRRRRCTSRSRRSETKLRDHLILLQLLER